MIMRFAFYGRVSTEDQQDPTSSKGWQVSRSSSLIEPHGGQIVAEYFDVGQSRSLPWKRRPEAARLLADLANPGRGFEAVVIGEPARAFYGGQFGNTYPLFIHHKVDLWVPEVGGRIDPGSDAHDLVMSLYGGMSKGERNRIKIRVRSAMAAQAATEGRYLGGRPPYGYRLADAGPHPNPSKAATGQRQHRLEPDPVTAPIVERIFREYIAGAGFAAIAERLTADGAPSPSAHDPGRNRHRANLQGAWGKPTIRAILDNPRYTGRQVWNRQRKEERLLDLDDVALGHETKQTWNDPSEWVWSNEVVHEALVSPEDFARVQEVRAASRRRPTTTKRRAATRTYPLSGLVVCSVCERRMQGTFNNGRQHYRCTFPEQYAATKGIEHPRTVYLREDRITEALDAWIATVFDAENVEATCEAMAMAQEPDEATVARREAAERRLADCDARLAKYRAALEAGADAVVVAGWMREVQGERLEAERVLQGSEPTDELTVDQVRVLVGGIRDAVALLGRADPKIKAQVYAELGIAVTYDPHRKVAKVRARPACSTERVGGGT
jgi:site-specific DNA recombinase